MNWRAFGIVLAAGMPFIALTSIVATFRIAHYGAPYRYLLAPLIFVALAILAGWWERAAGVRGPTTSKEIDDE